jgi:hypothetical protein
MRRWSIAVGLAGVVMLSAGAMVWGAQRPESGGQKPDAPKRERAPEGVRIRVQVLNGTKTRGLARRATMLLRDRGFDVVEVGTVTSSRDTTVVLDLSGHPDWARRVARALGSATRVETRADSSRYLDIAVVIGSSWRPPTEALHP